MHSLTGKEIEALREFDTPTVSNAVEYFRVRPRTEGFMGPEVRALVPPKKAVVGYAATCRMSAERMPTREQEQLRMRYYEHVYHTPSPTIAVIEDLDPKPVGGLLGDVSGSMHRVLGGVAVITNGGIRDRAALEEIGIAAFGSCLLVSHGYLHVEEYASTVTVGGLTIHPGDLLHADEHGVLLIPPETAPRLAEVCRKVQEAEVTLLWRCRERFDTGMSIEQLNELRNSMLAERDPWWFEQFIRGDTGDCQRTD